MMEMGDSIRRKKTNGKKTDNNKNTIARENEDQRNFRLRL